MINNDLNIDQNNQDNHFHHYCANQISHALISLICNVKTFKSVSLAMKLNIKCQVPTLQAKLFLALLKVICCKVLSHSYLNSSVEIQIGQNYTIFSLVFPLYSCFTVVFFPQYYNTTGNKCLETYRYSDSILPMHV